MEEMNDYNVSNSSDEVNVSNNVDQMNASNNSDQDSFSNTETDMHSNVNFDTSSGSGESASAFSAYYTESYKKPKLKRGATLFQLILVSLISSILGAGLTLAAVMYLVPAIQPSINSFLVKNGPSKEAVSSGENTAGTQVPTNETSSKIEIDLSGEWPVVAIAKKVSPSIVGIRVTARQVNWLFGENEGTGEGSGIIISSDGYIVTNYHVIYNALEGNTKRLAEGAKIEVFLPGKTDKPYIAQVVGKDDSSDLAVLKINETGLTPATLGDSDKLQIGELAVAIGNPGGLNFMGSTSAGVISGLDRQVNADNKEMTYIQTDAAINPGNSGGALANAKGEVIGVNTLKGNTQLGYEGMGFAIPINKVKEIAEGLIEKGYVPGKPYLGIKYDTRYTEEFAKQRDLPPGAYVADVELMGAAQKAGMKIGDIITKINGVAVKSGDNLVEELSKFKPGETVKIQVYRDGKYIDLEVVLDERKD